MKALIQYFDEGKTCFIDEDIPTQSKEWLSHPVFEGVALKHLVTGAQTKGAMSSHLVRVRKGHSIGEHIHEESLEVHDVLCGKGECLLDKKLISYESGVTGIIPQAVPHSVTALDEDLYILAKFIPALM
ncbi:MAG: cupin domain-containing protein [Desulfovibrio sp.]